MATPTRGRMVLLAWSLRVKTHLKGVCGQQLCGIPGRDKPSLHALRRNVGRVGCRSFSLRLKRSIGCLQHVSLCLKLLKPLLKALQRAFSTTVLCLRAQSDGLKQASQKSRLSLQGLCLAHQLSSSLSSTLKPVSLRVHKGSSRGVTALYCCVQPAVAPP